MSGNRRFHVRPRLRRKPRGIVKYVCPLCGTVTEESVLLADAEKGTIPSRVYCHCGNYAYPEKKEEA